VEITSKPSVHLALFLNVGNQCKEATDGFFDEFIYKMKILTGVLIVSVDNFSKIAYLSYFYIFDNRIKTCYSILNSLI